MMKISKSKRDLAKVISENGGWRKGSYAAQDSVIRFFVGDKPKYNKKTKLWGAFGSGARIMAIGGAVMLPNRQRTTLSRAEYFHLYPVPDAKPELCESVMRTIPEPTAKPTIEQLAADYRNKLDYANRKQDEADKANMESDAALSQLEDAIAAIGFVITPLAATEKEPELVAAVKVGDQVECVESNIRRDKYNGMVGRLHTIDESDTYTPYLVDFCGEEKIWCHKVKFIRRP